MKLHVNGSEREVDAPADMPLLWVLRDLMNLTGTKFGCGIAACGACTVHIDGQAVRSCVMPVSAVVGTQIRTIESLGTSDAPHRLQEAWIAEQVPQCGYCQPGIMLQAVDFLGRVPHPTAAAARPPSTRPSAAGAACA